MDEGKKIALKRWLTKIEHDILTAETMLHLPNPPADVICFHCQQCAEKSLKLYLVSIDQDFPKLHDLEKLLGLCVKYDESFKILAEPLAFLNDYAVEIRYVDDWRNISLEEATEAFDLAKKIKTFILQKLNIALL